MSARLARVLIAASLLAPAAALAGADAAPAPERSAGGERARSGSGGWAFAGGVTYGYFDQDGRLETSIGGTSARGSEALQLDGTRLGLHGRVHFPGRLLGGRPFVQAGAGFDLSDAEDEGGLSFGPTPGQPAFMQLSYQADVAMDAGLEWETRALVGARGLRLRPYAGLGLVFWDAALRRERGPIGATDIRNEDFATTSGRLGVELGLPVWQRERRQLELVVGSRAGLPLGDDEEDFAVRSDAGRIVRGRVDLDAAWAGYLRLELRWDAAARRAPGRSGG